MTAFGAKQGGKASAREKKFQEGVSSPKPRETPAGERPKPINKGGTSGRSGGWRA